MAGRQVPRRNSISIFCRSYKTYLNCHGQPEYAGSQIEGSEVHQNNLIYKGYRLTAKVSRGAGAEVEAPPNSPVFIASVTVVQAGAVLDGGDEYPVPCFADGGFVFSPREAVHAAILHGREIVDGLTGTPS